MGPRNLPSSKFLENLKTVHSNRIKTGEFPAAAVVSTATSKGDGKVAIVNFLLKFRSIILKYGVAVRIYKMRIRP